MSYAGYDDFTRQGAVFVLDHAQEVADHRHVEHAGLKAEVPSASFLDMFAPRGGRANPSPSFTSSGGPEGLLEPLCATVTVSGATGSQLRDELRRRKVSVRAGSFEEKLSGSTLLPVLLDTGLLEPAEDGHAEDPDEVVLKLALAQRTSGIFRGWTVLTNTIFGVGVLALSSAEAKVGVVLGPFFLMAAAAGAKFSLHLLSCVALQYALRQTDADSPSKCTRVLQEMHQPRPVTFYAVCAESIPWLKYFVDAAIAIKCFGVSISFLIVAAKMIPTAYPGLQTGLPVSVRTLTILFATFVVLPPICYRKRLVTAWITNSISLVFFAYIIVLVLVQTGTQLTTVGINRDIHMWPPDGIGVLKAIPVFVFAFTCHQNLFPVANELVDPSVKRLDVVTSSAIGTAAIAYLPIMVFGYLAYGSLVHNPVLENLPVGSSAVRVAQTCLFFSAVFCYPNQLHPCRRSIMVLLEAYHGEALSYGGEKVFRRVVTTILLLGSAGIALLVDNLSIVFQLIGGVASNTICYLVPTLLYLLLFPRSFKWYAAAFQLGVGCLILPCSLAGVIL